MQILQKQTFRIFIDCKPKFTVDPTSISSSYDSSVISKLLPSIKVHCWGGFGSQIYALVILDRIKNRYPFRRVVLIFHDGGVTRRRPEILSVLGENEFKQISDYRLSNQIVEALPQSVEDQLSIQSIRHCCKLILYKIGLIGRCNSQAEYANLRPWVLGIRGHYTKLVLTQLDFEFLIQRFSYAFPDKISTPFEELTPALHFRLGDLLSLPDKKPIRYDRVREAILTLNIQGGWSSIRLFSDSLPVAVSILNDFDLDFELHILPSEQDILIAFFSLVHSCAFVATPSKVSEWVVMFRYFLGVKGLTLIPKEMVSHFDQVLPQVLNSAQVQVY